MAGFIGNKPGAKYATLTRQTFSSPTGTSHTLSQTVTNSDDLLLYINNVKQNPADYSASGTVLTTASLAVNTEMYCLYYGKTTETVAPPASSVGNSHIVDVASSKLTGTIADARFPATLPASSGANLTNLPAANLTGAMASGVTGVGMYASIAIIQDQKAYDTHGGTFTSGAWRTRDLNTEVSDADGIVSIASNQLTLQAGTYTIEWRTNVLEVNEAQTRLYNITDSSVTGVGMQEYTSSGNTVSSLMQGYAVTTISGAKVFEVQAYCGTTQVNYGLGHRSQLVSDTVNVYTTVKILKHA